MLNGRDLSLMRTQQDDAMPDLVTVERRVFSDDGFGGHRNTSRVVIASGVPARIVPTAILEGLGQLARPVEVSNYTVRVPRGTPIKDEDYLIRESDGTELQVEGVKRPRSWDTLLTVTCEVVA